MRRRLRLSLAAAACLVLVSAACDDFIEVDPEDQRIAVGAREVRVCPDAATNAGTANVLATVFGTDGVRVEGVEIMFTASRGMLSTDRVVSDAAGVAELQVTGDRTPDLRPLVVTGIHPTGEMDDVAIPWPNTPELCLTSGLHVDPMVGNPPDCFASGGTFLYEVGQQFDVVVSVLSPCNISRVSLTLEYDDAFANFDPNTGLAEGCALQNTCPGQTGGPQPTMPPQVTFVPGRIDVDYMQVPPPTPLGSNEPFSPYLVFTFTAIAETPKPMGIDEGAGFAVTGYQLSDDDGLAYPPAADDPISPFIAINVPAP